MRRFAAAAAVLGWGALVVQFFLTLQLARENGLSLASGLLTYFSYFTILTNILVALALSLPLVSPQSRAGVFFRKPTVKAAIAVSIAVVGIVYSLFLRHLWQPQGAQLIVDVILHDVMPLVYLAYWWLSLPPGQLRYADIPMWLVYPVGYLLFALLRGVISGRYPYPFIDADNLGLPAVLLNCVGILVGFVAVGSLLVTLGRMKKGGARPATTEL